MNSDKKLLALSNAISVNGGAIVCLQETKKPDVDLSFIKTCCPKRFDKFAFVPSRGASGGLLTIWNSSVFSGVVSILEDFVLGIRFTSTISAHSWTLYNIYGPCTGPARDVFTSWLYDLDIHSDADCLFLGDFNYIRGPENRNKPGGDPNDMSTFNDIIRKQNLVELTIKGHLYTWSNMQHDPLLEQLDWFFTSLHWTHVYTNTLVKPFCKPISDHTPCVVTIETKIPRAKLLSPIGYSSQVSWTWLKMFGNGPSTHLMLPRFFVGN